MSAAINWDGLQQSFYSFLSHVTIVSKDEGRIKLEMYDAQRYFFDEVFDALRHDIHFIVCGKGRQLGITTACLLFDVFYAGAVPDIQGGIVFDSESNKEKFRKLIGETITLLPPSHTLPIRRVGGNNRQGLVFDNGNMLDYFVAGTKRGQGTLGRSRALNFCHSTETGYYGDFNALSAFQNTFSELFPARLYIFESTGNGSNGFRTMCDDAMEDELTKRFVFVTWWRKRTYSYARNTALFKRYGWPELSKDERDAAQQVLVEFGHKITLPQWAWYRHHEDPAAKFETNDDMGEDDDRVEVHHVEHPHTPEMMWRRTGSDFIPGEYLAPAMEKATKALFKGYFYHLGESLASVRIMPTTFLKQAKLKVWEEPSPIGVYVIGADTAYGASEEGDASVAQVVRCYADRMVQVAEFCDRSIQPYQFAWVLMHLCGWYGDCRFVMELYTAGEAVWTEIRNLKREVEAGRLNPPSFAPTGDDQQDAAQLAEGVDPNNFRNVFARVRQFLYRRQDSLTASGYAYQIKSTLDIKFTYMTQFGDRFMQSQFDVNSVQSLKEIEKLRKDGRSIAADGNGKDDRAIGLGLATKGYIDMERNELVARNATYAVEQARQKEGGNDTMAARYMQQIMRGTMASRASERRQVFRRQRSGGRWSWALLAAAFPLLGGVV